MSTKKSLILIDIQREYITPERPFYLNGIEESLGNCRELLNMARNQHWKIAHVQHLSVGAPIFEADSEFSDFVEGLEPKSGEGVFSKNLYSCFSNPEFEDFIKQSELEDIYLIGYNSIMCCLSTVIDGFHRGYQLNLVRDATYAKSTAEFDEQDMHEHAMSIIKTAKYATLVSAKDLLQKSS